MSSFDSEHPYIINQDIIPNFMPDGRRSSFDPAEGLLSRHESPLSINETTPYIRFSHPKPIDIPKRETKYGHDAAQDTTDPELDALLERYAPQPSRDIEFDLIKEIMLERKNMPESVIDRLAEKEREKAAARSKELVDLHRSLGIMQQFVTYEVVDGVLIVTENNTPRIKE